MKRVTVALIVALAGCSAEPAPKPEGTKIENAFRGGLQDRTSKSRAEALFVEKCGMCHRQMGMGTVILARRMDPKVAMLETHTDLTTDYIRTATRQGTGNMPRLSRAEVSDTQLATITAYLTEPKAKAKK
jgi:cytochrome c553